jgi:predicted Zn finger-like uncharacterized protein
MKITCPKCGANGNLPDHEIPEEGRFLSCPKCKHGFDVKKPKATVNEYLVDVCPACAYSTFGDERFGTCPKCGVFIKSFIDRQREEMARVREQEILNRKFSRDIAPAAMPSVPIPSFPSSPSPAQTPPAEKINIGEIIENLHPVNLIGYGVAIVAVVILLIGVFGVFDYYGTDFQAKLSEENIALGIEVRVSVLKTFMHHGLVPWIEILYGASLLAVAVFFLQKQGQARQALGWLLWGLIAYVPVSMTVNYVRWWIAPIPHTWSGYVIGFFNILFITALVGIPLYLLINFLDDKRIKSVVRL